MYKAPPPGSHVICVDEMGPVAAKSYYAKRPARRGERPRREVDYGRRGTCWTFGGLEPATGLTVTYCALRRDTANFLVLLSHIVQQWPQGELFIILDNLSIHKSIDVRLWLLAHPRVRFLFQPTYSPWLNLIEPWWKTLRSLALKGRCFDSREQVICAITEATNYWNQRRHPYVWRKPA